MDLGAPASGAWMESGLTVLLGGFQRFWTLGTNVGGLRKHNPSARSKAQSPPVKCLCGNTQSSGPSWDTKLSGHGDNGPMLRL